MKSFSSDLLIVSTAFGLFFLSSCSKGIPFKEPSEVVNACRIEAFKTSAQAGSLPFSTLSISYNTKGNPVAILPDPPVIATGFYLHFRYDGYDRLTDYIISFPDEPGAVIWHRYSYPDRQTIVDTSYDYVGLIDGPPPTFSFDTYVHVYRLDGLDRIISDNDAPFQYDRNGNLIRTGVSYDNHVNFLRTNIVWMLINKDFSRNNPLNGVPNALTPLQITGYNFYGLPLEFSVAPGSNATTNVGDAFFFGFSDMQIVYACDGRSKK
jgi:hypothetical protein